MRSVVAARFTAARCGARTTAVVASSTPNRVTAAAKRRPENQEQQLQCGSRRILATTRTATATAKAPWKSSVESATGSGAPVSALERVAQLEMSARQQHAEALPTTTIPTKTFLQTDSSPRFSTSPENSKSNSIIGGGRGGRRRKNPYEVFYTSLRRQRGEQVEADMNALVDDLLGSEISASGAENHCNGNNSTDNANYNGNNDNGNDAPFSNIKLSPMSLRRSRPPTRPEA